MEKPQNIKCVLLLNIFKKWKKSIFKSKCLILILKYIHHQIDHHLISNLKYLHIFKSDFFMEKTQNITFNYQKIQHKKTFSENKCLLLLI